MGKTNRQQTLTTFETLNLHRAVCSVTPWLALSGDLPPDWDPSRRAVLDNWVNAGVTDILDVRGEFSDEEYVKAHAPQLRYHYLGTHDDGGNQDKSWFEAGVKVLHEVLAEPEGLLLVHCHMGVNRGPSMGFALLLDQGWTVVDALDAILEARPIVGLIYAASAVRAIGELRGDSEADIQTGMQEANDWLRDQGIDPRHAIRRIRSAE